MASNTVNTAVVAPIPMVNMIRMTVVRPGLFRNIREP
jgi:hypothetical protein